MEYEIEVKEKGKAAKGLDDLKIMQSELPIEAVITKKDTPNEIADNDYDESKMIRVSA
jgi:hypothetical protein